MGIIFTCTKLQQIIGFVFIAIGVVSICAAFIVLFKNKNNKLIEVDKKIKKLEADKQDIEEQVEELLKKSMKQIEDSKIEKEKFEKENNIEELKNIQDMSNISEEELKAQIFRINNKLDSLIDEKNQLKNQIEFLENKIDEKEFLEADIENLKEEISTATDQYNILSKTESLLKEAKTKFSSSYLQGMTDGFNKYLKIIDNKDLNTNVDINLDVKIDANGTQKEIKFFSSGYKDLIYICMRFGLIEALFKDETPFVILDDPFVNLDEEKTSKALDVLNEFSEKYQVIYFVCNSSRTN